MRSALKAVLAHLQSPQDALSLLNHAEVLLDIVRTYGKHIMQQPEIINTMKSHAPEVYDLYLLLGGYRMTKKECLALKQALVKLSGITMVTSSHDVALSLKDSDKRIVESDPFLQVVGGDRMYRRSLQGDLAKLASA